MATDTGKPAPPALWEHQQPPEQSRGAIAAVNQAVQAAETASGVVASASECLAEIARWISVLENEAVQAAGEAAQGRPGNSPHREAAVAEARKNIDATVARAVFGDLRLLDGSLGCSGRAFGEGLEFVSASPRARASPPHGYPVWIWREATRATSVRGLPPPGTLSGQALQLVIEAEGRQAVHHPGGQEGARDVAAALGRRAAELGLEVSVAAATDGRLVMRHHRFGSAHGFTLKSSLPGVFSLEDGRPRLVQNGQDVAGSINGEPAYGEGQVLTGCAGNRTTDGMSVRFSGVLPAEAAAGAALEHPQGRNFGAGEETPPPPQGRVILAQQGLVFRLGPRVEETVSVRLNAMRCDRLGQGVENPSGFSSLAAVRLGTAEETRDALLVIRRTAEEVLATRRRLDGLAKTALAGVLEKLRAQAGRINALHGNIGDQAMALLVARSLRAGIPVAAHAALSAQHSSVPGAVLKLVSGELAPGLNQARAV